MVLNAYENIKQHLIINVADQPNPDEVLLRLKNLFKNDINSVRTFEQITTVEHLLEVLETRDTIGEDNMSRLRDIALVLPGGQIIQKKILDYHPTPQEQSSEIKIQSLNSSFSSFQQNNTISNKKIARINDAILNYIGSHWKDLARNLMLQEGKIDEIESDFTTVKEKAIEVLKEYEKIADPQKWIFVVCEALNKSRRRDISKNIMDIYTMNI